MKFSPIWKIAALIVSQALLTPALGASASSSYTVRSGDTFAKIARTKGIPLATLLKANRISNPDRIQLGQRITIPGAATAKTPVKTTAKTETKTTSKTGPLTKTPVTKQTARRDSTTVDITPPPTPGSYTVQTGDTLSRISRQTGVSASRLMTLNGLTEDSTLRIGQTLRTGGSAPVKKTPAIEQPAVAYDHASGSYIQDINERPAPATPAAPTATISHRVKSGQTFSSISRDFGISSTQLASANKGVDPHRLRAGQSLLIPGQPARPQAKPLTVRADGRILADHRNPLEATETAGEMPAVPQTRTGYQVEAGDTLDEIARRYNTTSDYLRGLNRMGPNEGVYTGRYLLVPFTPRNPDAPATRRLDS
jgi:LysM repeat protein